MSRQDRVYTKAAEVPEIWDAGYILFWKHIIRPPIDQHVYAAILSQIQIEREGYVINRSAVKECVDVLLVLRVDGDGPSVYKRHLEPAILRDSEAFYKGEGDRLVESCDAPEYLRRVSFPLLVWRTKTDDFQVESRFESEESRTHHYLSSHTSAPLRQILENNLLKPNLSTVISMPNSGLDIMIDTDKTDDLARLYRLFIMVPTGLLCLRKTLKDSIARRGKEINRASSGTEVGEEDVDVVGNDDDAVTKAKGKGKGKARAVAGAQTMSLALKWVQDVLDLKDTFDNVWKRAFQSDRDLESALNEVCLQLGDYVKSRPINYVPRPSSRSSISTRSRLSSSRCSLTTISKKASEA
jgi:cullin 3